VDCYRNKTRSAIESLAPEIKAIAPHYETRIGKKEWTERMRRTEKVETS
jgi:ribosomal protein S7